MKKKLSRRRWRGYRDLENGKDGANGDEAAGSDGLRRPKGALIAACIVAYFLSCLGIYYLVLGSRDGH
jgi:hypothetical protein